MHYEQSVRVDFSRFVRTNERESHQNQKKEASPMKMKRWNDDGGEREFGPKNPIALFRFIHSPSSSLSRDNTRRPSRAISTLAKDKTRSCFSLTREQRHRHHHHHHHQRDDDDDKRRPSKDDGYDEKKKKKTHHENIRDLIPNFPVVINQRHRARAARD